MKTFTTFIFVAAAAFTLIGCGAPANNAPANTNTNTNTAPKAPTAPTADALSALDKAATEAYFKGDAKYFETFLSDKYGSAENGKHHAKADTLKFIAGVKCDVKDGWKLDEPQVSKIDDDTYVLSYKGTFDGTCNDGPGGKTNKIPSPIRAATVFARNGDKWQAAWHSEMPMAEPKKDEKATDADKKAGSNDKKPEVKKEEPKKEDAGKAESKPAANTAANKPDATGAAPAPAPAPDANTDALVKLELGGWTAWKDKDAAKLEAFAAKNLAFIEPDGMWQANRADIIKRWSNTSDCTGVSKVDIKNGFAWALSPTVEILTYDATADGMCNGMKNGPMWGTSVYIKEGNDWKETFGFVQPAKKM